MGRAERLIAVAATLLLLWILVDAKITVQELAAGLLVVALATAVHLRVVRADEVRIGWRRALAALLPLPWQVVRGTVVVLRAALRGNSAGTLHRRRRPSPDRTGRLMEVWAGSLAPDGFIVAAGGDEVLEHRVGP